ncbi:PREDICTED: RPM1-interacting protein 4-like [Lupinus angustifolius]|uniref:RPM1-interacting protein 4-like n=1 Tax=Lupinus angustifolius TaxID=3871 RepID=UPI00092FCB68|nr:PREDICTED: RPM1-interacting protein 4-like [Lupinus angustifolius]XP_019464471.1 PREDICTED: RPM1-interacting protein 4-like [Lupinus angustifolius]
MASQDKGRALPKFGEWDVNNPASAEGFTVIFNKARDEKKTTGSAANITTPHTSDPVFKTKTENYPQKRMWFCCG